MMRDLHCSAIVFIALLATLATVACDKPAPRPEENAAIDAPTMAYLSMARALHHEANLYEDSAPDKALAAIDRLVAAERPKSALPSPEVEEVLADAYARATELTIRSGELDRGSRYVKEGLAHAPSASYFRGHLLEVDGLLEEARAAAFGDAGKPAEADAAKQRAIEKLEAAVKMQQSVIARSLGDGGTMEKR